MTSDRGKLPWRIIALLLAVILPPGLVFAQCVAISRSPDLPDVWLFWNLLAAIVSGALGFGIMARRLWVWAGLGAAIWVFTFSVAAMRLNIAWRVAGGVPEHWLLELSAANMVFAVPAAVIGAVLAATASGRAWLTPSVPKAAPAE